MATRTVRRFKYVDYLWNKSKARSFGKDEVKLLLYRSNLLGADLRITNFAGGNTSTKTFERDPLDGSRQEVLWVKGSGGDLGSLNKAGLASMYLDKLHALKKKYRGIKYEDEMVAYLSHCTFNLNTRAGSIDTPLHAFLPFKHIDHLHPDSIIAIAAAKDGEKITKYLFKGKIAWVGWQRPGFDLGLQLEEAVKKNPKAQGIILGAHGLFTWGETSYECYLNSLDVIEKASVYLAKKYKQKRKPFGGATIKSLSKRQRTEQAKSIMSILRGYCSSHSRMIGHFADDERVLEFVNSKDLKRLARLGTSCPDHFLRTKIRPMVLSLKPDEDVSNSLRISNKLNKEFIAYRKDYKAYYKKNKRSNSPAMRDPNPVVIVWKGIGMFTFAKNKQTSRVSSEFYINAINVMKGAEAISTYKALPAKEAFDIEYWLLEEAKLQRMPKEKSLSRKIALVTGAAGGIGRAVAKRFAAEGACVILADNDKRHLNKSREDILEATGEENINHIEMELTSEAGIKKAMSDISLMFGGLDILVNSAGLARSHSLTETSDTEWSLLHDVMVKGQFSVTKHAVSIMQKQKIGGDIVNIVSKNALVSGPNNVAYGTAKGAQLHMSRLLAAELGKDKIRVNVVNPDAVIKGSNIWNDGWAKSRAKAYNIKLNELPAFYAKRTLLNEEILPEDIADAVYIFVSGSLSKSTGNVLNVDGGIADAFVR